MPDDDEVGLRIARAALALPRSIAIAESLTGGALSARLARLPDASDWYRGAVVTYAADVKHSVLGAPPGEVVSRVAAVALADGVAQLLAADVSIAVTGVGGPDPQDGEPPGTVWMALHAASSTSARCCVFTGAPAAVVEQTCDAAVRWLADHLDEQSAR
jgi:nicotinamide-nucleotide amidase